MTRLILVLAWACCLGYAQTAESILDKAAAAVGSEKVFNDIKTSVMLGTMTLPQGIEANMTVYEKDGGKILVEMNAEAPGMSIEMRQGCNGTDCYSQDTFSGMRLLEGQEKEALLLQNGIKSPLQWRDIYQTFELNGTEDVEGRKAYKVKLVSKDGMDLQNYYDAENYRLLRSDVKQQSVMGLVDMSVFYHDYKTTEEGITYAQRAETQVMGQTMTFNISEINFNVPIPDSKFNLPPGLKN